MSRCGNDRHPGCGQEIDWGQLPDGRKVPLHRGIAFYRVTGFDRETNTYAIEPLDQTVVAVRVGHHRLCTHVDNFKQKPRT